MLVRAALLAPLALAACQRAPDAPSNTSVPSAPGVYFHLNGAYSAGWTGH